LLYLLEVVEELKKLEDKIRKCTLCPLHLNRNNAVPGEGSYNAEIMIIGEAPGEEEDRQGRPFVGKAGKILNEILEENNIEREKVFITNIVKCRPPGNREPTDEESKICMENYLYKQIELISPKIILLLGSVATKNLLNIKSVSAIKGKVIKKDNRVYFVTYHPAVALYNPSKKDELRRDFKQFVEIYKKVKKNKKITLEDFL